MQNGIGVTQFNGMSPKSSIYVNGIDWKLRRDATDSTTAFPHQRVNWMNAGCEPMGEGTVHYCWIMGVIAPTPGTLEKAISVMYIGFHPQKIVIAPNTVSQFDLNRMHIYTSDGSGFAFEFVNKFLGVEENNPLNREHIRPWPSEAEPPQPAKEKKSD